MSRIPILGTSSIIIDEPAKTKVSQLQPNFNDVKFEDIVMTNDMNNIVSNRKPVMSHLHSVMTIATVDITTEDGHFQRLPVSVSWPHPIEHVAPTF